MKVTVSKYYTPNGINIHGTGIEPDVIEELNPEAVKDGRLERKEDNQLDKALDVIINKIK